jgi:hypothetical protein
MGRGVGACFSLSAIAFLPTLLFLASLVLGRLLQGRDHARQFFAYARGLRGIIRLFRLGAVERLAPGAIGSHFLHGLEAVFKRGQVAARPPLLLDRFEPGGPGEPPAFYLSRLGLGGFAVEHQPVLAGGDVHRLAVMDLAREHHLGERVLHVFLDHALERPRAVSRVVALRP